MNGLLAISNLIDRFLTIVGKLAAWAGVVLIVVTVFDVVTRRFFVLGSTKLQEFEWHAHAILFMFLLGYAYLKDTHVRIDLVRERLGERAQWWLELAGCTFFLLPYCAIIIYFSFDFWLRSFLVGETSSSATGLPYRWIIKAALPIGFTFLGLAGIAVMFRKLVELFGPPELRKRAHDIEDAEVEHLDDVAPVAASVRDLQSEAQKG
jgi:TRAP-type mannitol/chloroaromatic compound transport system permease small subunit